MAVTDAIGTSLFIDYSSLKDGLAEANRLIQLNSQKFQTATAGLDDWTKSSEGLEAKLKSLSQIIELQKGNVSALEKEYEKVKAEKGENSKEAQQLALKLEKERTALAKSEKESNKFSKALEDLKSNSDKAGKSVDELTDSEKKNAKASEEAGEGSEKASSGFKSMLGANLVSSAITSLTASLGGLVSSLFESAEATKEYRKNMGFLEEASRVAGESVANAKDNLFSMASVSGDLNASTEAINNLLASGIKGDNLDKITKQLEGASIKWKDTLKLEGLADGLQETLATNNAIGPFAELLERGGQNLETFNSKLKNCTTEAEKQNLVMQYLSKMGLDEISDKYKENNKSLYESEMAQMRYNDSMAEMGEAIEPINTIFTNLKTTMIQNFLPSLKTITTGFVDLANGVNGAGTQILNGFGNMLSSLLKRISSFAQSFTTNFISFVPSLISKITEAFPIVISLIINYIKLALMEATNLFPQFTEGTSNLFSQIMNSVVEGFGKILEELPSLLENIFSFLSGASSSLLEIAKNLFASLVDGLIIAVDLLKENLPEILNAIKNGLAEFLPKVIDGASNLFLGIIDGLKKFIPVLVENLPSILDNIIDFIVGAIPIILENAKNLFMSIVKGLISFLPTLSKAVPQIITTIIEALVKLFFKLVELGKDLIIKIKDGILDNLDNIKNVGKNIIDGLINGMKENISNAVESVKKIGSTIINGFKNIFDIHSPSKVMEGIGENVGQGLINGLANTTPEAEASAKRFAQAEINAVKSEIENQKEQLKNILGVTFETVAEEDKEAIYSAGEKAGENFSSGITNGILSNTNTTQLVESVTKNLSVDFQNTFANIIKSISTDDLVNGEWENLGMQIGNTFVNALSSVLASVNPMLGALVSFGGNLINSLINKNQNKKQKEYQDVSNLIQGYINPYDTAQKQVVQNITFNQTNTSPVALTNAEIYRQTNKAINILSNGVRA